MSNVELKYVANDAPTDLTDHEPEKGVTCGLFQDEEDDFETDEEYRLAYGPPTLKVVQAGPVTESVATAAPAVQVQVAPAATDVAPEGAAEVERTEFIRHLEAAACLVVVRCRTVTPLEFFFNLYAIFKTIFTTILDLPGISMVLSATGADQIMNIPYLDHTIGLIENILKMVLLVGSKPAYKISLKDASGKVTYTLKGVVPKPKTLCTKLFPSGRHIQIPFKDEAGQPVLTYDMPKKPMCGKRRGAKICAGEVNTNVTKKAIDAGEVKVLGTAAKPSFCDNICQLRKVVAKGGAAQIRRPYFFTWSGWPNNGQPFINPHVEVQPAGAGFKGLNKNTVAPAEGSTSAKAMALLSGGPKSYWAQLPLPIIASTFATFSDVASEVGLGEVVDTAMAMQGSSSQGSGIDPAKFDAEAAKKAASESLNVAVRMRNILTMQCNLAPGGEFVRDYPLQERLDVISGMIWLDYSFCLKMIPS